MILLLTLIGIALVDSLNPSLFIAQFYLFSVAHPIPRIASYIGGVLTANYVGGLLIYTGLGAVIERFTSQISAEWGALLQVILGLVLVTFAILFQARPQKTTPEPQHLTSGGIVLAYLFGMLVMGQEIPTALPYFVALERMAEAQLSLGEVLVALGIYNLVFALPLFAFLGLFLRYHERFTSQIVRISAWVNTWSPRLLRGAALIGGVVLLLSGISAFDQLT